MEEVKHRRAAEGGSEREWRVLAEYFGDLGEDVSRREGTYAASAEFCRRGEADRTTRRD